MICSFTTIWKQVTNELFTVSHAVSGILQSSSPLHVWIQIHKNSSLDIIYGIISVLKLNTFFFFKIEALEDDDWPFKKVFPQQEKNWELEIKKSCNADVFCKDASIL